MSRDSDYGFFGFLGRTVIFVLALIVRFVLEAVLIYKYWQWFVVPVVRPSISPGALELMGVGLFVAMLRMRWKIDRLKTPEEKKIEEEYGYNAVQTVFLQLCTMAAALGLGWFLNTYVIGPDPAWLTSLLN